MSDLYKRNFEETVEEVRKLEDSLVAAKEAMEKQILQVI